MANQPYLWCEKLVTCQDICSYDVRYTYIYIKLATVVESDPKAPFSIATTLRSKGGCYSIP